MYKNKIWLKEKYWDDKKSISEISIECNVTNMTIHNWMVKFEIPRRSVSESNSGSKNGFFKGGIIENYDWLKSKCENGYSLREISIEANMSKRSVVRWLKKYDLRTKKIQKHASGEEHPNWTGKSICECGNKKDTSSKICQKCYIKILKSRRGKLSPNWKGVADIKTLSRVRVMPNWRKRVFERDNYTCMSCGDDKGGNLEAHHIKRFSVIVDEIINTKTELLVENAEDRMKLIELICLNKEMLSIYNGITLCKDCHREIHKGKQKSFVKLDKNV